MKEIYGVSFGEYGYQEFYGYENAKIEMLKIKKKYHIHWFKFVGYGE